MDHFLGCSKFGDSLLVEEINSIINEHAIQEGWSLTALVWASIALRTNTVPIMFAHCEGVAAVASSNMNGYFVWRTPYPYNREIRRVTVLPRYIGQ